MMSLVSTHKVRCRYSNPTDQIQIVQIVAQPHCFFERTVLPYETICFEADPKNILEVHTGAIVGAILSDRMPCDRLQEAASESWRYPRQLQQSA